MFPSASLGRVCREGLRPFLPAGSLNGRSSVDSPQGPPRYARPRSFAPRCIRIGHETSFGPLRHRGQTPVVARCSTAGAVGPPILVGRLGGLKSATAKTLRGFHLPICPGSAPPSSRPGGENPRPGWPRPGTRPAEELRHLGAPWAVYGPPTEWAPLVSCIERPWRG